MVAASFSRGRLGSVSSNESTTTHTVSSPTTSKHAQVSTYRSAHLEMQIYSSSVEQQGTWGPLSAFSDSEHVNGRVVLDPAGGQSGRLSISIEGAFVYPDRIADVLGSASDTPSTSKHVFFSNSTVIPVSTLDTTSRPFLREAFSTKRRPSASSLSLAPRSVERSYPFSFELPRGSRSGEEMPPTFSTSKELEDAEGKSFEVAYKIVASWEASGNKESSTTIEVPIIFYPDPEFHSVDFKGLNPNSWLEMPLRSDRPIPFRCAVTLPTSVTFSRTSSIPYFVVFTTTPRSPQLAREIASDATISVSLRRQITIMDPSPLPLTPPPTPPSSGEDEAPRAKLLKRVTPRLRRRAKTLEGLREMRELQKAQQQEFVQKPLPRLPKLPLLSESKTLRNSFSLGFPKRPRCPCNVGSHPSLDTFVSLPDGLHKAKIPLGRDMLPCIDWAGVSVKYYLDVSVLIGQDDLRARIPIRIY
ncbi:hypothetical protein BDN72DRAFT_379706 [Pluteus cervinus]|uniref:Uncharacterized protein n=1 Tax=Pluteus cervinus TaxID=181527 RepID=A0ACD3B3D2_9AGAR|nr:hypothetical protein BDN72DRAFT_379706 [Pluteus cervinus]